jgi:hypothetical protein
MIVRMADKEVSSNTAVKLRRVELIAAGERH